MTPEEKFWLKDPWMQFRSEMILEMIFLSGRMMKNLRRRGGVAQRGTSPAGLPKQTCLICLESEEINLNTARVYFSREHENGGRVRGSRLGDNG